MKIEDPKNEDVNKGAKAGKGKGKDGKPPMPIPSKNDDADVGDKDDDGDDEEDGKKSLAAALAKSRADVLAHLNTNDPSMRRQALLTKANDTDALSEGDRRELIAYLSGATGEDALKARVAKGIEPTEGMRKSIDASPLLNDLVKSQSTALVSMADHLEKSMTAFNETAYLLAQNHVQLSKSIENVLENQESIIKSHEAVLAQPQGAPRSVGVTPTARRLADGGSDGISDSAMKKGLMNLFKKSEGSRKAEFAAAIQRWESTRQIDDAYKSEVQKYIDQQAQA